jgi:hypothetical protein
MTRKLDQEHLESIQNLQAQFAANANNLGAIAIDEHALKQAREQLLDQFDNLRKQETALLDELKARYGEGQINIQDGTFTPDK